jgi:RNA polymerase sigma-70 factor (ECF subfamily)
MTPCHAGRIRAQAGAATPPGRWEALMAAAQAGDGAAYDTLLREALPMLRGMARRRIADPAEAEDAVQDALLTFHRLRHAYDPARPLRPWLAAICDRRCLDRLRRRMRATARETPIEPFADSLSAPWAEDGGDRRVAGGELRAAVAALPRAQRIALTLAKLQDLPLAEASARSGLSVGALKVATHRAVRTLRLRLGVAAAAEA